MLRAARSPRNVSAAFLRCPHGLPFCRSISGDAKQEIIQRLLSEKPITHIDELTLKKVEQFHATIRGFIPSTRHRQRFAGSSPRKHLFTRLSPGQYLMYFNSTVPTEQLLPDGTDTAHSPGDPFSQRLWAGGRIQFPQIAGLDTKTNPEAVLVEYVRDVRITGPDGQEKIFVKIERRVIRRRLGTDKQVKQSARDYATQLRQSSEDDISEAIIVETRDLCFLREKDRAVPFERRRIPPPTDPDYSHSLIPTPALLFRFSALTFNAHAIHIDPEYTRNVYGFPNLLVHGPLTLTMMLEYMREILLVQPGSGYAPVITEISYRNLAPLFANEEMTICIKRKRHAKSATDLPATMVSDAGMETTKKTPTPLTDGDDTAVMVLDEDPEIVSEPPPKPEVTESGIDIGKGFPTPASGEDAQAGSVDSHPVDDSKPKSKPPPTKISKSEALHDAEDYPQEWEIWIQTGQGEVASLAVRGTIKVEAFDKTKQLPAVKNQQQPLKGINTQTSNDAKSNRPALMAETLETVKTMLGKKGVNNAPNRSQLVSKEKNQQSKRPVVVDMLAEPITEPQDASLPLRKVAVNLDGKPAKLVRYSNRVFRRFSTQAGNVLDVSLSSKAIPIRKV